MEGEIKITMKSFVLKCHMFSEAICFLAQLKHNSGILIFKPFAVLGGRDPFVWVFAYTLRQHKML